MKLTVKIFSILLALFYSNKLLGQIDSITIDTSKNYQTVNNTYQSSKLAKFNNTHFSLNLSASYIKGVGMFTGITPSVNYQASQRLNLEFGASVVSGMNNNSSLQNQTNYLQTPANQYFLYGQGNYLVTDKLMFTGSFYTTANSNQNQTSQFFANYRGLDVGFDYKLTKNVSLGAQFSVVEGNYLNQGISPLYYNHSMFGY